MSCVDARIIDYNYAFESGVSITASSATVTFPVSNLSLFHRSKIWRSSGNYVIDSTNNKINFKETGLAAELTATLTSGTYTATTLAAQVKTQLEAASVDTFTVTFLTSGKFKIESSGTAFELLFSTGTNTATSARNVLGYGTNDYTGATEYTASTVSIHTEEAITFDLSTTEDIDSFCLVFDPSIGINFTNSVVLKLQANATNVWTSPAVDVTLTVDNETETVSHYFTTVQSYRYWRLKIVDSQNPDLYVQLGKVFLGKALDIARVPSIGFQLGLNDRTQETENEFGNKYFDVYPIEKNLSFNLDLMEKVDSNIIYNSFTRIGKRKPVLVVLDSTELLFDKNKVTVYGFYDGSLTLSHVFKQYMGTTISMKETF